MFFLFLVYVVQTNCPWVLRYLTTAIITQKTKRREKQNVLKNLITIIQQVWSKHFFLILSPSFAYQFSYIYISFVKHGGGGGGVLSRGEGYPVHAQQHAESSCIIFIYYLFAFLHARTHLSAYY